MVTGPGGEILAFPHSKLDGNFYDYNVTATYSAAVNGAFIIEYPFSVNESFFIFPSFGPDVVLNQTVSTKFTISGPSDDTFINGVSNASNWHNIPVGSNEKQWVIQEPAGSYQNVMFTFLYNINTVENVFLSGLAQFLAGILTFVAAVYLQARKTDRQFTDFELTVIFIPALAVFTVYFVALIEIVIPGGYFTGELLWELVAVIIIYAIIAFLNFNISRKLARSLRYHLWGRGNYRMTGKDIWQKAESEYPNKSGKTPFARSRFM